MRICPIAARRGKLTERALASRLARATALLLVPIRRRHAHVNHLILGSRLLPLHPRESLGDPTEQRLYVVPGFRRGLDKHDVEFFALLFRFFWCHLALIAKIRLVAYEHDNDIVPPLCANIIHPFRSIYETLPVCDIIHYDRDARVSDVAWNQASESLLPGSVP